MAPKRPDQGPKNGSLGEYLRHFLKFLTTFVLIIGIALFLFSFTGGG